MKHFRWERWKTFSVLLGIFDALAVNIAYFGALLVRFDFRYSQIPGEFLTPFFRFVPIYTVIAIVVFALLKLYRSIWRFASYAELFRVIVASVITAALHTLLITVLFGRMPISYYMIGAVLQFIFILGIRFSYRFVILLRKNKV